MYVNIVVLSTHKSEPQPMGTQSALLGKFRLKGDRAVGTTRQIPPKGRDGVV